MTITHQVSKMTQDARDRASRCGLPPSYSQTFKLKKKVIPDLQSQAHQRVFKCSKYITYSITFADFHDAAYFSKATLLKT